MSEPTDPNVWPFSKVAKNSFWAVVAKNRILAPPLLIKETKNLIKLLLGITMVLTVPSSILARC